MYNLYILNIFLVICEIGLLSKNYCELSGRSDPLIADVILGFVEMGKIVFKMFNVL